MAKGRILLGFLCAAAAFPVVAGDLVVAEFRADRGFRADRDTYSGERPAAAGRDDARVDPGTLYAEEIGGSDELSWSFDQYTFSGILDWGQRANYLGGERYSDEHFFSLGSRLAIGDSSETLIYYGYAREQPGVAADLYHDFGDADTARTGLSQTLYFADEQASIGVGYEYATGERERLYRDREGHKVNVRGRFHLGWGFNAHLEAGYGLYSYSEYDGIRGNLSSARTNMRAGISRSFTSSFKWGLHYSYVDEEFEDLSLSERRETWGLNLEYRY